MALLGSQRTCTRRREGVICGCILNPGLRVTVFSYLHLVCYALLTPALLRYALSVLCTSGHCALCVAHSWPLHCVWYALLSPALVLYCISEHCSLCITHSCTLCITHYSVHYAILSPAFCIFHTLVSCRICYTLLSPARCVLSITWPCNLCSMHSWPLCSPEPCTLSITHSCALYSIWYALLCPALCITCSWSLHPVCHPLLGPAYLCILLFWTLQSLEVWLKWKVDATFGRIQVMVLGILVKK